MRVVALLAVLATSCASGGYLCVPDDPVRVQKLSIDARDWAEIRALALQHPDTPYIVLVCRTKIGATDYIEVRMARSPSAQSGPVYFFYQAAGSWKRLDEMSQWFE
jgi:hypothetical protein